MVNGNEVNPNRKGVKMLSIAELELMSVVELEKLSGVKIIQSVFGNGPHGRKVEMSEFKAFDQNTREAFVDEIRPVVVAAAKV